MFGKKSKKETASPDIINDEQKETNVVVDNTKKKIDKKKKVDKKELGAKNSINFFKGILEILVNKQILTSNDLKKLLDNKKEGFFYKSIIEFLDDVINIFGTEKEKSILESFFKMDLGYKLHLDHSLLSPSTTILDLFNTDGIGSLSQETIDNIFNSNILPIQINIENKINSLTIISRSPEIPNNLLEIFKEILEKRKILDMEFILVNKSTYEEIFHQLDNDEYEYSL